MNFLDKKQLETIKQYTQRKIKEKKREKIAFIMGIVLSIALFYILILHASYLDSYYFGK